jgi:tetratricopeptide (TPR) repeat protein
MTDRYKMINNVVGWLIFIIASIVFISSIEPTASFWDCGEYIACSYKLEVGHPPGAPTFMLIGRLFSLFATDPKFVAAAVNTMSALSSAGTILFMFWSLTLLGKKLITAMGHEFTDGRMWAIIGSGAVGSLAYCFSDSFWFSAVEGEVYAMSSLFTAIVFWAILRWDADDSPRADRWLVFIAYMIGLSVGVHLLNLLTIPSIVFIIYFKKYKEITRNGLLITTLVAVGLLGVVQNGIIPGVVSAAANFELLFVNSFSLPFNAGTIIYFVLLIGMIVSGLRYTMKGGNELFRIFLVITGAFFLFSVLGAAIYGKFLLPFLTFCGVGTLIYFYRENRVVLNTVIISFTVLMIGYSSFFVLVIRSKANTPMDENNPENAISLLAYLNREQYGDWPLVYGPYYNAPLDVKNQADDGNPVYGQDTKEGNYAIIDSRKQTVYNFAHEMSTIFPRMWESQQKSHAQAYEDWSDFAHHHVTVKVPQQNRQTGELELQDFDKPTFAANLKYFKDYQIGWMYGRYFMWNFAGKENDIQGHGNLTDGNWQSGLYGNNISVKGTKLQMPKRLRENAANNKFFYLPLLLGLIGMFFHFYRDWKNALVIMLLFLFTGLAIVVYLNQYPLQPRERDYAYAGSFFAFAFWIGFGVYAIYDLLAERVRMTQVTAAGLATIFGMGIPYIMGKQGWNDHNRSNRYTCRDFAENYLTTCAKNAILFTNGDNDTFPLWYAQEVEEFRTDMRVLNLSLLNTDWYIEQASRKAYTSERVPFSLPASRTRQGSCDQVFFDPDTKDKHAPMSARELIDLIKNCDPSVLKVRDEKDDNDESFNDTVFVLPTNKIYIPVDKALVKSNGTVPADTPDSLIVDRVEWTINKSYLLKADLMILDLLASNNWNRPVYFAVTAGSDSYLDLEGYFNLEGLAYRLVPMKTNKKGMFNEPLGCNTALMYKRVMGVKGDPQFPGFKFGGLEQKDKAIYMDENNLRFTTNQRLQMMTLAKLLNDEGKHDEAKAVLDRCLTMMPKEHVPYEPAMVYMVDGYYHANAMTEANGLSKDLFDQCEEEYTFYSALAEKPDIGSDYEDDANRLGSALQMLGEYAQQYGQKDLAANYTKRLMALGLRAPDDPRAPQQPPQMDPRNQRMLDSLMNLPKKDSAKAGARAHKTTDK